MWKVQKTFKSYQQELMVRLYAWGTALIFFASLILPPGVSWAQMLPVGLALPAVGTILPMSATFTPALLRGVTIKPDNPLAFDFIVNKGDTTLSGDALKAEGERLIKYFLATLTIPEDDLWVNLSPYEADRIIPEALSQTAMGREMLAQDYMLKQLTASMMVPDEDLGHQFWQRVYQRAQAEYGTTDIFLNTFNKVWIVPETAEVYEHNNTVVVVNSRLKVMLEEDFLALEHYRQREAAIVTPQINDADKIVSGITSGVVRDLLIPEIEREVNEGATFASLRQVYNSMILATWYKQALKDSLLHQVYVDQRKIAGVDIVDKQMKDKIYAQYIVAFQKGVVDMIKEEPDPVTGTLIPRKYFSGGQKMDIALVMTKATSSSGITQGSDVRMPTKFIEYNLNNWSTLIKEDSIVFKLSRARATLVKATQNTISNPLYMNAPILGNFLSALEEIKAVSSGIHTKPKDVLFMNASDITSTNKNSVVARMSSDDLIEVLRAVVTLGDELQDVDLEDKQFIHDIFNSVKEQLMELSEDDELYDLVKDHIYVLGQVVGLLDKISGDKAINVNLSAELNLILRLLRNIDKPLRGLVELLIKEGLLEEAIMDEGGDTVNGLDFTPNIKTLLSEGSSSLVEDIDLDELKNVLQQDLNIQIYEASSFMDTKNVGGIDFNSGLLDLQIKRDGQGVPLPIAQQPIGDMRIEGFFPVILNISPINLPLFLGIYPAQLNNGQLSAAALFIPRERFATRKDEWV